MDPTELTPERLRDLLHYDSDTGSWHWIKPTSIRVKAGAVAGRKGGTGHWQIGIDGKRYPSARLAFLYMTGEWPSDLVDHIDCDPDNNRWINLRQATRAQNAANSLRSKNNTSGYKGVTWAKREQMWVAQIAVAGRHICLGYFSDPLDAANAYAAAAETHFGSFARAA